jgi:tetratricopeptide (TPR) repeat protein
MYVYRTPAFNKQLVEQSGLSSDHFNRLCAELETMTLEQLFSRFERVYPYLKRKERNLRLIARIHRVGNEQVLCWLKIFRRGDRAYEEFLRDRDLDGNIQELQLQQWLQEQKAANYREIAQSLPLDETLLRWLERPDWSIDTRSSIIYESQSWLTQFTTVEIQDDWEVYHRAIATLADAASDLGEAMPWTGVKLYGENNRYILYSKITTADTPARQVLFLLAPFPARPSREQMAQAIASIWAEEDNSPSFFRGSNITLDELTTLARRAYPSYLLADEHNWRLLEQEENVNLALSAEEEAILHAVSTTERSLPLFLNGQAGSGKSTMLFHLFADYCHRHLRYATPRGEDIFATPHPLFLAYNDRLLEVAKNRVTSLLASHHRFLEQRGECEDLPDISPFFHTFRAFLRNLLPLEERDRFLDANYISFHRFRQLFQHKTWRNYSPERCWQVIRTFIKGYHLDERDTYLEEEDYAEVPKKERTVSLEEFKGIYNSVWKWYERQTKVEGLWDDQDLIRTVLKLKCYRPEYTAIFCDEAQDFTRLELQLIMRLSVFSNTDLERQYVECLPFAFAGDPLQTLNPTGFRWESLKAAFYNEVIATLSPTGQLGIEMNFTELECNYRSIPAIVGANNLIQLWRSVLFNIPDLKPQQSRRSGNFEPQKLIFGENISAKELRSYLQDTIVIIPCDEGGELDYARTDEVLCALITPENGSRSPWNVLSAIAAKGLEFKQVVLYKFGEVCPPNLWHSSDNSSEAKKYFFNKLYVATSRATERLFIVDTERGERQLWRRASDAVEFEEFLQKISQPKQQQKWRGSLQAIQLGDRPELLGNDDLPAIAQMFETQGIETENPEFLRRAKGAYQRLQNEDRARLCEAWALKFEGEFLAAGRQFVQQGNVEQARACFWQGMCWQEFLDLYEQHPSFPVESSQLAIARFLGLKQQNLESIQAFSQFLETESTNTALENYHFSPQWQTALKTYASCLETLIHQQTQQVGGWRGRPIAENLLPKGREATRSRDNPDIRSRGDLAIPRPQQRDSTIRGGPHVPQFWGNLGVPRAQQVGYTIRGNLGVSRPQNPQSQIQNSQWQSWGNILSRLAEAKYQEMAERAGDCFYLAKNYDRAVECWEAAQSTQKTEYNLAKAEVLGLPAGLDYLLSAQQYDRILTLWQQAKQPREPQWLNAVAPTLEAQEQYLNALIVYGWLDNLAKVKACFDRAREGSRVKALKFFLQYTLQQQHWDEAIATLETHLPTLLSPAAERVGLKYFVVYTLSRSPLTPETLDSDRRQRFERFIKERILPTPWTQYLLLPHLGIALEKIGSLVETLEFYERYVNDSVRQVSSLARDRWLATKTRQANYFRTAEQLARIERIQAEINAKAKQWGISLDTLSLTPPIAPARRPTSQRTPNITGLPQGLSVVASQQIVQFQLRHLVVKIMLSTQQVLIADTLSEQRLRIDVQLRQVCVGAVTVQSQGGERLTFSEPNGGYSGVLSYENNAPRLELTVQGLSQAIAIEF